MAGACRHAKVTIAIPSCLAAQVALGKHSLPPRQATFLLLHLVAPLQREALWAFDQADFCHAALQHTATTGHSVNPHCLAALDEVLRLLVVIGIALTQTRTCCSACACATRGASFAPETRSDALAALSRPIPGSVCQLEAQCLAVLQGLEVALATTRWKELDSLEL